MIDEPMMNDLLRRLEALRDELTPLGGEALAAAERQVEEARIEAAVRQALPDAGISDAYAADVAALLDESALTRNSDGQPHASAVRAEVARIGAKYPLLAADDPPQPPPSGSFDGGTRQPVPPRVDTGAAVDAALR